MPFRTLMFSLFCFLGSQGIFLFAQEWRGVDLRVPEPTREFRAAWVAVVHHIDWPSQAGLSAHAQKAELKAIFDQAAALRLNAILLQVRPAADALYQSKSSPWAHWLSGQAGQSPGYDPLQEAIRLGRERGIEVHAWFNPFRALASQKHPRAASHVTKTKPHLIKRYGDYSWLDPSSAEAQELALQAILEVVQRYDIDGVHIDDYFYPYPVAKAGEFPDAKEYAGYRANGGQLVKNAWRRQQINRFVQRFYQRIKATRASVRVGISPFGIWKPGIPEGTTAGLDAYEQLAADSRLWLQQGWCDYLAPQLYWRIEGPQSFPRLLTWWRAQSKQRPVWPGIATSRILSDEDKGRPASEIANQVKLTRQIGSLRGGHVHWSMKALMQNRGGIRPLLAAQYPSIALPPAMTWIPESPLPQPRLRAKQEKGFLQLTWQATGDASKIRRWLIQERQAGQWRSTAILPASRLSFRCPVKSEAVALRAISGTGRLSAPIVVMP